MKPLLRLILFIPVVMADLPPGGLSLCNANTICTPLAEMFTRTVTASPDLEFKDLGDPATAISWSVITNKNHIALRGNLKIGQGEYVGSGNYRLQFIVGCVDLDLNGKDEFIFLENTLFLNPDCEHKIRDSSGQRCLDVPKIQWLKERNFKILEGIETCKYNRKPTTLTHDLNFDNFDGADLELLSNLEHINGRLVCEDSVLNNLDFLAKVKTINELATDEIPPLIIKNCLVLNKPNNTFLPRIRKIWRAENSEFHLTTFDLNDQDKQRLKRVTRDRAIDFVDGFEIDATKANAYDDIIATFATSILVIPVFFLIALIILNKKKLTRSDEYLYRNLDYMELEMEAITANDLKEKMPALYSTMKAGQEKYIIYAKLLEKQGNKEEAAWGKDQEQEVKNAPAGAVRFDDESGA